MKNDVHVDLFRLIKRLSERVCDLEIKVAELEKQVFRQDKLRKVC
ncbi:MAG: hypothetical protein QXH37_02635 [Candidatus Bathyarchaeia archaeon]